MTDLNGLERALASVAPGWGVRRLQAKFALDQARASVRGFDGARQDRRTAGWRATGGGPNAELAPALATLQRRSRDLVNNNEWALNAQNKLVGHIVGTGFILRPVDKSRSRRALARECWNRFSEQCDPQGLMDFNGLQALAVREVITGGAAFMRWRLTPPEFGLKVPLHCEVLAAEHLDTRKMGAVGGNIVINGVEFDAHGRRAAYWLFPVHPGEFGSMGRGLVSERVPASEVDHMFNVLRAGQVTGVPWFAATMLRLRDVAEYEEAELVRQKIAACLAVFVKTSDSGPSTLAQVTDSRKDGGGRRLERLKAGLISYLRPGEDIATTSPPANTGYKDHMDRQHYAAAAGVGLTFAQFTGNVSQANYSSLRESKVDIGVILDQRQHHMVIPMSCRPAWRRVMAASAGRGYAISPEMACEITAPRRPWVDPLKDVKAEGEELALGLESWAEKASGRGYDPEDLLETLKSERAALAEAGIVFGPTALPMLAAEQQDGADGAKTEN